MDPRVKPEDDGREVGAFSSRILGTACGSSFFYSFLPN